VQVATIDPVRAAPTDQALILKIWTARLRIDHVETFQASASKVKVAAAGPAVAAAASEEIALAAAGDRFGGGSFGGGGRFGGFGGGGGGGFRGRR